MQNAMYVNPNQVCLKADVTFEDDGLALIDHDVNSGGGGVETVGDVLQPARRVQAPIPLVVRVLQLLQRH